MIPGIVQAVFGYMGGFVSLRWHIGHIDVPVFLGSYLSAAQSWRSFVLTFVTKYVMRIFYAGRVLIDRIYGSTL